MEKTTLEKINRFTRRELGEDEVYTFSVILCDNDIDRDLERFSDEALVTLAEKFIGRTGISDHDPSSANQTARIFDTQIMTDESRTTASGAPYRYLKAEAYMVRTSSNAELIKEIDGGIKKEVSISCSAAKRTCSVCGAENGSCAHVKGKSYGGKVCHTILGDITDSYEWSFVAVPAQINAGVTKRYTENGKLGTPVNPDAEAANAELRRDIRRLAYFCAGRAAADIASLSAGNMDSVQLIAFKKSFEKQLAGSKGAELQLAADSADEAAESGFSMK